MVGYREVDLMAVTALIAAAASLVPSIIKWTAGDKAGAVADKVADIAMDLTGEKNSLAAIEAVKANPELSLKFQEAYYLFELGIEQELTRRHQADMVSDSWLAKNIRPLCLLALTVAIMVGVWLPDAIVSPTRFVALTDMSQWVYGYYFVGRTSEKGGFHGMGGLFGRGGRP